MKTRIFSQVVALCALSMGLVAQDEPAPAPAPVPAPEPAPVPAPAPAPVPAPEPAPVPAPEPAPVPAPEPAPVPEPEPAPVPTPAPITPPPPPPAPKPAPKPAAPEVPADVAAPPADAEKTASGLSSKVLKPGTGTVKPTLTDRVRVHYTGWQTDGHQFDSSVPSGRPAMFPVSQVIPGWTEGLQLMVVGEKRRLWIPGKLAYGELEGELPPVGPNGKRPGRPLGMLCFDVELVEILPPRPKAPPTPENLTAAPADAEVTASGLATQVLKAGTGTAKPKPIDNVRVHFTLWTSDGRLVESTPPTERPAVFPLKRTVPGFTEALQLMVEGESRRIWIPQKLAYGATPPEGAPKGMLIFEVELLKIFSN